MARTPSTPQAAWMIAGLVVAAGAIALVLTTQAGRAQTVADRTVQAAAPGADLAVAPTLAVPLDAEGPTRIEAAEDLAHALGAPAGADAEAPEPCLVEGVLLLPRGFPAAEAILVHGWSLDDGVNAAPVAGTAGSDRSFRVEDVPSGAWTFVVRAEASGRIAWGRSDRVTTVPGGHLQGVRVVLEEYGVEGVVTDRNGQPLAGLPVAYSWNASDPHAGRSPEDHAAEDLDPSETEYESANVIQFSLDHSCGLVGLSVPPGSPRDEEASRTALVEMMSALQGITQEVNLDARTAPPVGISSSGGGRNISLDGATFSLSNGGIDTGNIRISFAGGGNGFGGFGNFGQETVTTDGAGVFRIPLEGPGQVSLTAPGAPEEGEREWVHRDQSVSVDPEAPLARADFELQRAARIEGTVSRSDGDPAGISVFLRRVGGGGTSSDTANEEGRFDFGELAPGRYLFYARSGGSSGQDFSLHLEIDVTEGGTAYVDDILTPSSSVTGQVQDATGQPLTGVRVIATGVVNNSLTRSATTDPFGAFEIVGMYACEYSLSVNGRTLGREHRVDVPPQGARTEVGALVVE